jgi:hypothetical protein
MASRMLSALGHRHTVDLYAELDVKAGDQFRVAVEAPTLAFYQLVVHGASPA